MEYINKPEEPHLDKGRHVKYWTRCLKTLLPTLYTSNDSNRMYLAYFILAALDLLDSLLDVTTERERNDYVTWIYWCQHPRGGFRMWPGTNFDDRTNEANERWDPANVPATYFALASLLILGDDFNCVKRRDALLWLRKIQRSDGSFGETLYADEIQGGKDPRFGYCASGIRHILRGRATSEEIPDVNVDALVRCVQAAESYEGGLADEAFHEPHAGYTFCCLGSLCLIDRLRTNSPQSDDLARGPTQPSQVLRWLVERQTDYLDAEGGFDTESIASAASEPEPQTQHSEANDASTINSPHHCHQSPNIWSTSLPLMPLMPVIKCIGMNGRINKVADTCYAFWVTASLHILGHSELYHRQPLRRYLLEMTQHEFMGGFTKFPGDKYADLYHSYLGLAALSLVSTDEEREVDGVKELDAGMCLSKHARARLTQVWSRWDSQEAG